jgi:signal transduction histidine kinase/CheY-like chemotaxis protein
MVSEINSLSNPFYRHFKESGAAMALMDFEGFILAFNRPFGEVLKIFSADPSAPAPDKGPLSIGDFFDFRRSSRFQEFCSRLVHTPGKKMLFETSFNLNRAKDREGEEPARWFKVHAWIIEKDEQAGEEDRGPFIGLIIEDQTRVRQEEMRLQENREIAQRTIEAKSQFLANTSHELRTPIQTIIGMTELLQDTKLDREQAEYSGQLKFSAEVLLNLVNDILDYSKIEAGKMEPEHIDFSLEQTIEQAVEMISLEAHQKGLEIVVDIPPGADIILRGDPHKFRQVVINLAKNAVKFTAQGGVVITARLTEMEGREALNVAVADTGIGVPEESRSRLFTNFMQAGASNTRRFGGTGLGLAISRGLVEMMRGKIEMLPNKGGGSIFHFTMPIERSAEAPEAPKTAVNRDLRILVADDRPESRRILMSYLKDIGYVNIEAAASGEEALTFMRTAASGNRPYGLCFLDMIMPVMDGWRLAAEIHNDPAINEAGLILMVPHGLLGADTKMTLLKWFKAYINKPVKRRILAETVETALAEPQELEAAGDQEDESAPAFSAVPGAGTKKGEETSKSLILIAEDHLVNQKLFSLIMEKLGYPSITAADGEEALEKAAAYPVSLIFMDIQMPLMNGWEAAKRLRRRGFTKPIIAITASAFPDEQEAAGAGIDDILLKPFKRQDIEQILLKWINREHVPPETPVPRGMGLLARINSGGIKKSPLTVPAQIPSVAAAGEEEIFKLRDALDTFMGDAGVLQSVLAHFLQRTENQINALGEIVEKADWESARREAHTIKGSALTLGAKELGHAAALLELAFKEGKPRKIETCLPLLQPAFTRFRKQVEPFLKEPRT